MLKKIAIGVGVLLVGLVGAIAMQPSTFAVQRSQTMAVAPAVAFANVNDFRKWDAWSPWAGLDPDMETTHEGPETGAGSKWSWSGNDDVGVGSMLITGNAEPSEIKIDLVFVEPFPSEAKTVFTFAPEGDGTTVTWAMSGENDFMGKAFGLFMDMDDMIGADFEKGLGKLKTVAEAG